MVLTSKHLQQFPISLPHPCFFLGKRKKKSSPIVPYPSSLIYQQLANRALLCVKIRTPPSFPIRSLSRHHLLPAPFSPFAPRLLPFGAINLEHDADVEYRYADGNVV